MQLPMRLSGKAWTRLGALAVLLLAVVASAMTLQPRRHLAAQAPGASAVDPLRAELARCQALGQAGAADTRCLAAWVESRRRFLVGGLRP